MTTTIVFFLLEAEKRKKMQRQQVLHFRTFLLFLFLFDMDNIVFAVI